MTNATPKILIIEPRADRLEVFVSLFKNLGCAVHAFHEEKEVLELLENKERYDVALVNLHLPTRLSFAFLEKLEIPVVGYTPHLAYVYMKEENLPSNSSDPEENAVLAILRNHLPLAPGDMAKWIAQLLQEKQVPLSPQLQTLIKILK